ncbi:DUF6894 family protein [Methylobacterium nigriterrae]|uniref:DUF6894 family protein n=1 Tax=Methylobacterium nigriterrae TaxID=3127512 RepID=UPI003013E35D
MPRFHFNVYDGVRLPDAEGTDLPDWQAARLEAIRKAGEILKEETRTTSRSARTGALR